MKEIYESPNLELTELETEDIITLSEIDNDLSDPWGIISR